MNDLQVAAIDRQVLQLFAMVTEGVLAATDAFLNGDRDAARALVAGDRTIDTLRTATERLVFESLVGGGEHTGDELQWLVSALQIVPEIERSGDLVEHIALRTPQQLARELTPAARRHVEAMGRIGAEMWQAAADAYEQRDAAAAGALRRRDDELDDLHVQLSEELAANQTPVPVAIEMALIARFYERLGDHAVNIARRIRQVGPRPALARSAR